MNFEFIGRIAWAAFILGCFSSFFYAICRLAVEHAIKSTMPWVITDKITGEKKGGIELKD